MIAADDVGRATTGGVTRRIVQPTMIFGLTTRQPRGLTCDDGSFQPMFSTDRQIAALQGGNHAGLPDTQGRAVLRRDL